MRSRCLIALALVALNYGGFAQDSDSSINGKNVLP